MQDAGELRECIIFKSYSLPPSHGIMVSSLILRDCGCSIRWHGNADGCTYIVAFVTYSPIIFHISSLSESLTMFTLSFLAVALFILDASLVSARPRQRRSPTPVASIEGLTTNAKRFIAGLPPLPPIRRWIGSQVDCASSLNWTPKLL